jgi:hypothetical protein
MEAEGLFCGTGGVKSWKPRGCIMVHSFFKNTQICGKMAKILWKTLPRGQIMENLV